MGRLPRWWRKPVIASEMGTTLSLSPLEALRVIAEGARDVTIRDNVMPGYAGRYDLTATFYQAGALYAEGATLEAVLADLHSQLEQRGRP